MTPPSAILSKVSNANEVEGGASLRRSERKRRNLQDETLPFVQGTTTDGASGAADELARSTDHMLHSVECCFRRNGALCSLTGTN